jgi:hypothetical protein
MGSGYARGTRRQDGSLKTSLFSDQRGHDSVGASPTKPRMLSPSTPHIVRPVMPVKPSETACAEAALRALGGSQRLVTLEHPNNDQRLSGAINEAQSHVLSFLLRHSYPYLTNHSVRSARNFKHDSGAGTCPSCGTPAERITAIPASPYAERRRLIICSLCGVIADAPLASDLSLAIKADGIFSLTGVLPNGNWSGAIKILPRSRRRISIFKWPNDGNRCARSLVVAPEEIPREPCHITVFIFQELSLACLSTYVHGDKRVQPRIG